MERVDFSNVKITGGFWKKKQDMVRNTTVHAVYNRFKETGRFDAFKGKDSTFEPHIFWDSDVAKWIEGNGMGFTLAKDKEIDPDKQGNR